MEIFKRKSYFVGAVTWKGDNLREVINLIGLHKSVEDWPWERFVNLVKEKGLKIPIVYGQEIITIGSVITKAEDGQIKVYRSNNFNCLFELIKKEE